MNNKSYEPGNVTTPDPAPPTRQPSPPPPTPERKPLWRWQDVVLIGGVSIVCFICGLSFSGMMLPSASGTHPEEALTTVNFTIAGLIVEFLVFTGSVYFLGLQRKQLRWEDIGLQSLSRVWLLITAGLGLMEYGVELAATYAVATLFKLQNSDVQGMATQGLSWVNLVILFALAGVAVPFAEELLFRGVLYNFLRERWGIWAGAFLSALLYALISLDLVNGVAGFVLSVFAILAYERSRSLWAAIGVHMVSSLGSLILFYAFYPGLLKMPIF